MNKKITIILVSSLCWVATTAFSANGYTSTQTVSQDANSGYSSSQSSANVYSNSQNHAAPKHGYSSSQTPPQKRGHHRSHRHQEGVSFYVNVPEFTAGMVFSPDESYFVAGHSVPHGLYWLNRTVGNSFPHNTVVGGGENGHALYICHADYRGGVHPGKIVDGKCHISYAGNEIAAKHYQVLVSNSSLGWLPAEYGSIPPNAISGGYENGHPLFICQAEYGHGLHPGKLVGQSCNIGVGGREISIPYYNVLVA